MTSAKTPINKADAVRMRFMRNKWRIPDAIARKIFIFFGADFATRTPSRESAKAVRRANTAAQGSVTR